VTGGEKQESKHGIEGGNNNNKLKLTKFALLHSKPIREDGKTTKYLRAMYHQQ
jgi:hypothetical protein